MPSLRHAIARAAQHATAQGTGRRGTIPAPVAGWNTRDPESAMKPIYALVLDNWFPEAGVIRTRRGSKLYADTAAAGQIGTLVPQEAGSASRLFAVSTDAVYDVSDPDDADPTMGLTNVALQTAITSNRWRWANLAGQIVMVNGTDAPIRISAAGSTVAHGFSGASSHALAPAGLAQVVTHQNRLFFTEKDTTKLWYGSLGAVTGELSSIDLGLVSGSGGNLAALGSVTLDTGAGVNDLLAVITTRGTVYLYRGTDPSNADDWGLQGIFQIGSPVGDRPVLQLGADLVITTVDGYVPLMQFIRHGRSQAQYSLSDTIGSAVRQAITLNAEELGWEAVLHATSSQVIFNAPQNAGPAQQFVMNSQTGAWCRFTGLPAECWAVWQDKLFFGTGRGEVWQADIGVIDGATPVRAFARTAFTRLGSPYSKQARRLRAHIESPTTEPVAIGMSADYDPSPPLPAPASLTTEGGEWNTARWSIARWGSGVARHKDWKKAVAGGVAFSLTLAADLRSHQATFFGAELLYDQTTGAAN